MADNIVIKSRRETDVTDEQLFELTRESYQMWIDHGLLSEWRDFTAEDNQYCYEFQKHLVSPFRHHFYSLYCSAFFCRCCYLAFHAVTLLTKDSQGQLNILGWMVKRVLGKA